MRPDRLRKEVVLPLVSLLIERSGPFLKLLDVSVSGRSPKLWACLKFPSYERGLESFWGIRPSWLMNSSRYGVVLLYLPRFAVRRPQNPREEYSRLRNTQREGAICRVSMCQYLIVESSRHPDVSSMITTSMASDYSKRKTRASSDSKLPYIQVPSKGKYMERRH